MFSASEPRISKEIFAYYLSKELDMSKYEIKKLRTFRNVINVKDLILDYVKFETPEEKVNELKGELIGALYELGPNMEKQVHDL